jgi:uncharacterized alkaline shock family protein YloU
MSNPDSKQAVDGTIVINPRVVFSLALDAAIRTYGVLGIASRHTGVDSTRRDPARGLEVKLSDGPDGRVHAAIDVHVIAEYGVRLQSVISSLQHQISYAIEQSTGYAVDSVKVHVAGIRVSAE